MRSKTNSLQEKLKYRYLLNNPYYIRRDVKKLAKKGLKESIKSEKNKRQATEDYPVDFVLTWVDGNDPIWLNEKRKYQPERKALSEDTSSSRFRDWDNLQYWFRAIEKYSPWVRYVFFITYGHIPSWLNTNNPKLKIIKHVDYIPKEYLPTFSSRVIEANFWRIEELSERFVYFNDDMFLTNPVSKSYFFSEGLPRLCAISKPNKPRVERGSWNYARLNNCRACNSKFSIKKVIEDNPEKWFSYKYGKDIKYNIRSYEDGFLAGMVYPHASYSFRKTAMKDCYYSFQDMFELTCSHKFRTTEDLNIQVFEMWEMMHNTFEPCELQNKLINSMKVGYDQVRAKLNDFSLKCVCINDGDGIDDESFESVKTMVNELLQKKYPQKSSFEI